LASHKYVPGPMFKVGSCISAQLCYLHSITDGRKGQCLDVLWKSRLARKDDCEAKITLLYPGVGSLHLNFLRLCFVSHLSQFHASFYASLKRK